ncbi:MAG: MarR family winged helix-turn-helix transcriptional regulator [Acidimicrobiia bacterium]
MVRKEQIAQETWQAFTGVMDACRVSFLDIARRFDLTPGEMRALGALDPEHAQPMGALAGELRCDASNVTWLADRLEERGLVERRTDPSDRRVKTLALTDAGRTLRAEIEELLHVPPAPLLTLPVHELRTLRHLLGKCAARAVTPGTD